MQDPKQQEIFKKFKEGIFPYVIKSDVLKKLPYVENIELLDEFHVNQYTGKIYPLFVVRVSMEGLNNMYPYLLFNNRKIQENVVDIIQGSLNSFYPTGEFNVLAANVEVNKV